MKYIRATEQHNELVFRPVQNTISTVYPRYYPKEIVDFFCQLHSRKHISEDIKNEHVGVLLNENHIIGTGSYSENHITRVYVAPAFQGSGYGSMIMQNLEDEIAKKYNKVRLDASLPACLLYEHRGYKTVKHEKWSVENGIMLVYEVMEKHL